MAGAPSSSPSSHGHPWQEPPRSSSPGAGAATPHLAAISQAQLLLSSMAPHLPVFFLPLPMIPCPLSGPSSSGRAPPIGRRFSLRLPPLGPLDAAHQSETRRPFLCSAPSHGSCRSLFLPQARPHLPGHHFPLPAPPRRILLACVLAAMSFSNLQSLPLPSHGRLPLLLSTEPPVSTVSSSREQPLPFPSSRSSHSHGARPCSCLHGR
jgi:hypothetical protein